ncbi:MAG: hypothetical protein ACK53Y_08620, partial [bacterium]
MLPHPSSTARANTTQAVADDRERLARHPARRLACRATRRSGGGARRQRACPGLDVEPGLNDSFPASRGRCKQPTSPRSTAGSRCSTHRPPPLR